MHLITEWDPESQALFAYNRYHPEFGDHLAFASSNPVTEYFTADRTEFIGRNHQSSHPAALKRKELAGLTGAAVDPCAALQVHVTLDPGEEKEMVFILGYAKEPEQARQLILQCRDKGWIDRTFQETLNWWDKLLGSHSGGTFLTSRQSFPQPLAALSKSKLPLLGKVRLLSIQRRLRLPRPASRCAWRCFMPPHRWPASIS